MDPGHPPLTRRQQNRALATLIVAMVLEVVDLTIVNTALPAISTSLGASALAVQWMVAGYAFSFALLLMAGGRLGDRLGYRRMFLWGAAGFTLASAACGLATTPAQLVLARLVQGGAAAIMSPQALALMHILFTPLERVSKLALFGLVGGLAAIAGPVLGGLLIGLDLFGLGWRLVFLINLPFGLLALVAGRLFLPDRRSASVSGLDAPGLLLMALAVLALLWPLTRARAGWGPGELASLALVPLLAGLCWRHVQRQARAGRAAVFDPALLAVPPFRLGLGMAISFAAANAGFLLALAFGLQSERGQSALTTGLLHMPFGLGAMLGIAVLGRNFLPRLGKFVPVAGGAVMLLAAALVLAGISRSGLAVAALAPALLLAGLGMGTLSGGIAPITVAQVGRDHAGVASGMLKTAQQIGSALGIAITASVYFLAADSGRLAGSLAAAVPIALLLAISIGLALRLPANLFGSAA